MSRTYKRNCDYCKKYYEGYGVKYCHPECAKAAQRVGALESVEAEAVSVLSTQVEKLKEQLTVYEVAGEDIRDYQLKSVKRENKELRKAAAVTDRIIELCEMKNTHTARRKICAAKVRVEGQDH